MRSPCLDCEIHLAGTSKVGHPRCVHCEARVAYVRALGGMTHSVPVAMTTYGGGSGPGNVIGRRITAKETEDMATETKARNSNSPTAILERLCEGAGITRADLTGPRPADKARAAVLADVRRKAARLLHENGMRQSEIGPLIGVHPSRVCQILRAIGVLKSTRPVKKKVKERRPRTVDTAQADRKRVGPDTRFEIDILGILFSGQEKTLEQVRKVAAAELRTPEAQVVYIVKTCIEDAIRDCLAHA